MPSSSLRICKHCNKEKPLADFPLCSDRRYREHRCNDCKKSARARSVGSQQRQISESKRQRNAMEAWDRINA